jgi:thiamine kinase-like enzyme
MRERRRGDEDERLSAALAALLGPAARGVEARRLGGGIGHVSYLVELPEESYVLRLKHAASAVTLGVAEEFELLRAVAAAGITAEAVRMDAATGALLTRFVPRAVTWSEAAAREGANIVRIAELLRRLHGVAVELRDFEPVRYAETYFAAATKLAPLTAHERRMAAELRTLAAGYAARYAASALCHNDLVAANILDVGDLVLVDFEYAARSSPVLDLASLAAMNDYDQSQCRELLRAYYATSAAAVSAAEFAKVVRMVRLMAYFWALALPQDLRSRNARYLRRERITTR